MSLITLSRGKSNLVIDPFGAHIRKWNFGNRDVMYAHPDNPKRATHPCGPIFHELTGGSYELDGKPFTLDRHGFLRTSNWAASTGDGRVDLELANLPDKSLPDLLEKHYPFYFKFAYRLSLVAENIFTRHLAFTNLTPGCDAPVDFALHDYYPFIPGMTIPELAGKPYWDETDWSHQFPTTLKNTRFDELVPRDWHFPVLRPGSSVKNINELSLVYPDGLKLAFRPVMNINKFVVWTAPKEGNFLCAEPVGIGRDSLFGGAFSVGYNQTVSLVYTVSATY